MNQTFTILSSSTAINGTFAGLANGMMFSMGGHMYRINYTAFNSVVLTFLI